MKHSIKRIAALLLICLFTALLVTACGNTGDKSGDQTVEEITTEEITEEETTEETTTEETTTEEPVTEAEPAGPHGENLEWHGYLLDWEFQPDENRISAYQNQNPAPDGMRYVILKFAAHEGTVRTKDVEDYCFHLRLSDGDNNIYDSAQFTFSNINFDAEKQTWYREEEQSSFCGFFAVPESIPDTELFPVSME